MNTLKQKMTSRKLWVAIVGIVVGLSTAFGLTENDWGQIVGVVTSAVSVITYIFAEGSVDAKRAENSAPINITIEDTESDIDDGK